MKRSSPIDYNTIFSPATVLKSFGSAVDGTLPLDGSGLRAMVVRVTATAAGFVRMSSSQAPVTATKNDTLIQPGDFLLMRTAGMDYVSFISDSASATCTISPQEWGGYVTGTVVVQFSPAMLFTAGVTGVWYDPSDITTLYRDAAGTQPVTAVEQPVGLMLDKSKNAVGTNGAKRVNLLTYTEQFDNGTIWEKAGSSNLPVVTADYATGPIQGTLADRVQLVRTTSGGDYCQLGQAFTATVGTTYTLSVWMRSLSGSAVVDMGYWNSAYGNYKPTVTTDWQRFSFTFTASGTVSRFGPLLYQTTGTSVSADLLIYGAQLEVGSTATAYQKITDTWYNTLPGNHAFNSSGNSANFPVLSARYNLLTKTEQFDDAAWSKVATTVTANAGTDPLGGNTADSLQATSANSLVYQAVSGLSNNTTYKLSVYVKTASAGATAVLAFYTNSGGTTVGSQSFTTTGAWQLVELTVNSGTLTGATWFGIGGANSFSTGEDILVWGADLRVANDGVNLPAYQRVNTATDYDTVGFKPYLRFNGTNQWLQTNSIDFTYTDKMFVSAGVRKLSDAALGMLIETSTASSVNNGTIYILAPAVGANYQFRSKGTNPCDLTSPPSYAAPITNVLTGIGNISAPSAALRINGSQVDLSTATQGTGNYGNYPLYIGARAGTSLWFNGRLYQMVVAGKQASAAEITSTETYINQKTGAY